MSRPWIKMRTDLDDDPHVIEMASALGVHENHVVGMLWKIWSWADSHSLDGNALRVTCVTLDRFAGVSGFADALRKVGWLDGRDGSLSLPRFAEHNGQTAKTRAETAERVAKHRNAKSVTDVTPKPLPDKRRVDKRRIEESPPPARGAWDQIPIVREHPELADAIAFWLANWPSVNGGPAGDEGRVEARIAEALSAGWGVAKIVRSIRFSVTRAAKRWLDPDDDFDKRPRRGGGRREPVELVPTSEL
jgi:hypothetical protein